MAWVFRTWGETLVSKIPVGFQVCEDQTCYGVSAVYRISFCLAIFHALHDLVMIGVNKKGDMRLSWQDGFWLIKIIVLIAGIVGSFFIPNDYFEWFGWVALVGSGFFLVAQLLYFVDFAHSWAENWIEKYHEQEDEPGCKVWWWALLSSSIALVLIALTLTILMFVFFARSSSCELNITLIILNIVAAVGIIAISMNPRVQEKNPKSGLLQSGLITAYTTYLIWSALQSSDNENCNPFYTTADGSNAGSNVSLLLGAAFTIMSLVYSTIKAAHSVSVEAAPLKEDTDVDHSEHKENDCKDEPVGYNVPIFHLFFFLGSLYLAMLMSDWATIVPEGANYQSVDFGQGSLWVKTVSSWLVILVFIWTLVAPVVFPDREFGNYSDV